MDNDSGGCLGLIIAIVVIYFVFQFFSGYGKYEGQTGEDWFNEYDALVGCVEEYPHDAVDQCL